MTKSRIDNLKSRPLLTTEEVAILFPFPVSSLRRWAREGKLTHIRLGKCIYFRIDDVERFINENRKEAKQSADVILIRR